MCIWYVETSRQSEVIPVLKMSIKLLLVIFLSFTTYFNKSQSVTAVTTRVITTSTNNKVYAKMVKTKKKGTQYGNQNGGNQGWKPPTSKLMNLTFDYGTRMDTRAFKRNIRLIARKVAKKIKHRSKEVVKACNTGITPVAAEPSNS